MAERGSTDLHRTAAIFFVTGSSVQSPHLHRTVEISIAICTDQTADGGRSLRSQPTRSRDRSSPKVQSNGDERSWKNSTIAARSNRDRGVIEPRSWKFHCGIASTGSDGGRLLTRTTIDSRSWPNRGENRGQSEAKLKHNRG